jgi:hypothetical protein
MEIDGLQYWKDILEVQKNHLAIIKAKGITDLRDIKNCKDSIEEAELKIKELE